MFERSYQPRHVRENLLASLDVHSQVEGDEEIFQLLRRSSLQCDELAPINAGEEDVAHWKETRKDLRDLLSLNDDYSKHAKIQRIVKGLSRIFIQDKRKQYFQQANQRRALGQATGDLANTPSPKPKHRSPMAEAISAFLEGKSTEQRSEPNGESIYIELMAAYLDVSRVEAEMARCFLCSSPFEDWTQVWKHTTKIHSDQELWPSSCPECARLGVEELRQIANHSEWSAHVHENHAPRDKEPSRCLLGCGIFADKYSLARHIRKSHDEFNTITTPFSCPECRRLGLNDYMIKNPLDFRQHIELHHNSKLLPPISISSPSHACLLCENKVFSSKTGLSTHTTQFHLHGTQTFETAFPCPECHRLSGEDYTIKNLNDWCQHVRSQHGAENAPNPPQAYRPRCLLCNKPHYNEKVHFARHVKMGQFKKPFACPECIRQEVQPAENIQGRDHWLVHCAAVHDKTAPVGMIGIRGQHTRCFICNEYVKSSASHFTKKHVAQGLFNDPFQCPECIRTGEGEGDVIENREQWLKHCAAVHGDISSATLALTEGVRDKRSEMMSVCAVTDPTCTGKLQINESLKRGRGDKIEDARPNSKIRKLQHASDTSNLRPGGTRG